MTHPLGNQRPRKFDHKESELHPEFHKSLKIILFLSLIFTLCLPKLLSHVLCSHFLRLKCEKMLQKLLTLLTDAGAMEVLICHCMLLVGSWCCPTMLLPDMGARGCWLARWDWTLTEPIMFGLGLLSGEEVNDDTWIKKKTIVITPLKQLYLHCQTPTHFSVLETTDLC